MQTCRPERPTQILVGCEFVPELAGSNKAKRGIWDIKYIVLAVKEKKNKTDS